VEKPSDVLREKQEVTARVIEVNPEQRRMRLSLSALEEPQAAPHRDEEHKRRPGRSEQEKHQRPAQDEVTNYTMADLFKDQNINQG
jgi:small subunit ribosomal protein S1